MRALEIYKITNIANNKIYVGMTTYSSIIRFNFHVKSALHGAKSLLYDAIRKYGKRSFVVETLQSCKTVEELRIAEQHWIRVLHSQHREIGYNIRPGGNWSPISTEEASKISKRFKNHALCQEHKRKISKSLIDGYKNCSIRTSTNFWNNLRHTQLSLLSYCMCIKLNPKEIMSTLEITKCRLRSLLSDEFAINIREYKKIINYV